MTMDRFQFDAELKFSADKTAELLAQFDPIQVWEVERE